MAESSDNKKIAADTSADSNADTNAAEPEATKKKLTPLEAIKQAQAARQNNANSGGSRGGNKGQPFGQGGAAASRKPTTGRRSIGGA